MESPEPTTAPPKPATERPAWLRYAVALVVVATAVGVRRALTPSIGPTALPFVTFFPAIAVAAWFGGLGPGVLALGLSTFASNRLFFEPRTSFEIHDWVSFAAFLVASGCIVAAFDAMHRARRRVAAESARRTRIEMELAGSRDLLMTTLSSIGDGVVVTDVAGRVTFLNPEAERLTGWTSAEAKGRPLPEVFRIINEDTRAVVPSPAETVMREGKVVGLANHTLLIAKDGRATPIDDSAAPVRAPDGALDGVVLVFRDATDSRAAAVAKGRLAAIVESSGDAIVSKDLDGIVRTWNKGAERMFGWRREEIVGRPIITIIPTEHLDEERRILERIRAGHPYELLETVRVAKDGRRIPVSLSVSPVHDKDGRVVGASKIAHDLSEIVAAREAVAREKELLATTLASIGDAVIATDAEGRVTFLNPVARQLTGWSPEDAVGRPLPEVFRIVNETSRLPVENPSLRALREGVIVGLANHTVLLSRTGEERAIDDSAAPIRSPRGEIVGSVLVFRDVTERRRTEAELLAGRERLRRQADQLIETDRRKNEFLATLAHELRNPLAPIRNSIALLQMRGSELPELVSARDVIERQVQHMARLLDDLLDVNRLGRAKLELRRENVTLSSLVESAVETARPLVASGRHELKIDLPATPIVVFGDAIRLSQVFANLLNNAAKYMDPGGRIELAARRDGAQVVVSVKDAGIGIAAELIPTIFEMFQQSPVAMERAQGGIGIGLALARGIVGLHGGTIEAHSEGVGKGSEFVVRLPVAEGAVVAAADRPKLGGATSSARRILIADDLADNADTLAMMLRALGHDVRTAYDGAAAFATAEEWRPEVVLLDIGMPKLDGYAVCRRIRAAPWGRSAYVVAQTGWGQEVDRRRAKEAGFDHHLLKPVDCGTLVAVLAELPKTS